MFLIWFRDNLGQLTSQQVSDDFRDPAGKFRTIPGQIRRRTIASRDVGLPLHVLERLYSWDVPQDDKENE